MRHLCMVPAKPLARAKLRLSPVFSPTQRLALVLAMLRDVVEAARSAGDVWVVCSDEAAEVIAGDCGAVPYRDPTPAAGLNPSLDAVTAAAAGAGYDGVLILSSDLACVSPLDVDAMLVPEAVAIAPSADGGTNALWRTPPALIPTAFGPDSMKAHERLARDAGVAPLVVERPGLALDVDLPHDLEQGRRIGLGRATAEALDAMSFSSRPAAESRYRSPGR